MENKYENSTIHENSRIFKNVEIKKSVLHKYSSIGDNSVIHNSKICSYVNINRRCEIYNSEIGHRSYIGVNSIVKSVKIGKYCSLSWNLSLGGKNHNYHNVTTHPKWRYFRMDEKLTKIKPDMGEETTCEIGNDVWIGANTIVLRNVSVGDGAVIGAGSVISKNVPAYAIVAGNPGKIIKYRFSNSIIESLLSLKWWDWPDDIIRKNIDSIYSETVDYPLIDRLIKIQQNIVKQRL